VNDTQKTILYEKASKRFTSFAALKVAVLGLTYKPGTDDCRESPAADNIALLLQAGANIMAFDPVGIGNFKKLYPEGRQSNGSIAYTDSIIVALDNADVCFIFTDWGKIKTVKPDYFRMFMKTPIVYDGRNIFDVEVMLSSCVEYHSIGRRQSLSLHAQEIPDSDNRLNVKQYRHNLIYNKSSRLVKAKFRQGITW
ncbi:MAG TPA: UDP binding domain-containing protein, partial [Mobilitalea sp.]|nr:UDP binding domain-containing protein [Mobilitalea sp.]